MTGHTAALNSVQMSLLSAPGEAAHRVPNTPHFPLPPKHLHTGRRVPDHRVTLAHVPREQHQGRLVHAQWSPDSVQMPSVRLSVLFFSNQIFKAHRVPLMLRTSVWISLCQFIFYFPTFYSLSICQIWSWPLPSDKEMAGEVCLLWITHRSVSCGSS